VWVVVRTRKRANETRPLRGTRFLTDHENARKSGPYRPLLDELKITKRMLVRYSQMKGACFLENSSRTASPSRVPPTVETAQRMQMCASAREMAWAMRLANGIAFMARGIKASVFSSVPPSRAWLGRVADLSQRCAPARTRGEEGTHTWPLSWLIDYDDGAPSTLYCKSTVGGGWVSSRPPPLALTICS